MKYTKTHAWVKISENLGRVGISAKGLKELGEIVFIDFPKVGDVVENGSEVAVLESTKAATDFYAPIAGVITRINETLVGDLGAVNSDPESEGWLFEMELKESASLDHLLDRSEYLENTV